MGHPGSLIFPVVVKCTEPIASELCINDSRIRVLSRVEKRAPAGAIAYNYTYID